MNSVNLPSQLQRIWTRARESKTMWASGARFVGSCESRVLCMDWQESSSGEGGWLVTGCSNGTVGVSWIASKEVGVGRRCSSSPEEQNPAGPGGGGGGGGDGEEKGRESEAAVEGEAGERDGSTKKRFPCEDNLACTKEACLYKSHFILRSHTGEVSAVY